MRDKPIGVTMGWAGDVVLSFSDGKCLFGGHKTDMRFYPEYFPNGCEWPIDPATGEKLPIAIDEPPVRIRWYHRIVIAYYDFLKQKELNNLGKVRGKRLLRRQLKELKRDKRTRSGKMRHDKNTKHGFWERIKCLFKTGPVKKG